MFNASPTSEHLLDDVPGSIKLLIEAISDRKVQQLCLNSNAIGAQGVQSFDQFLTNSTHLQILNLSNCKLDAEAMNTISDALQYSEFTQIKEFYLSINTMGSEGAKALAKYFISYDKLTFLEIEGCRIQEDGMNELLQSLVPSANQGSLIHLDVSDN